MEEENLYEELQLLKNFYLLGFGSFFRDFLLEASALSLHSYKKHFSHGKFEKKNTNFLICENSTTVNKLELKFTDLNDTLRGVACSYPHMDDNILSKFMFKIVSSKNKDTTKTGKYFIS